MRDWLLTQESKASIAYLERVTGIPVSSLVNVEHGVGTWLHSDLAEILAQWISVEYRFAVVALIKRAKANPYDLPTDKIGWMRLAAETETRVNELELRLEQESPLVAVGKAVLSETDAISLTSYCQVTNHDGTKLGRTKYFQLLRDCKILQKHGHPVPYQKWVDAGYFEIRTGHNTFSPVTWITPSGELWLPSYLAKFSVNVKPVVEVVVKDKRPKVIQLPPDYMNETLALATIGQRLKNYHILELINSYSTESHEVVSVKAGTIHYKVNGESKFKSYIKTQQNIDQFINKLITFTIYQKASAAQARGTLGIRQI